MKIFALNLCIEFAIQENKSDYTFEPIGFEDLMGHLFKGTDFSDQQFYVRAENTDVFRQHIFDLHTNEIWRNSVLNICLLFPSPKQRDAFLDEYRELFREVDAAGGIVYNENAEFLMIYNRSRWTFPKGGVEWRETIEEAAVREVKEETGLDKLQMGDKMGETYHTFRRRGKWVLKTTHWYYMNASSTAALVPQKEEKIEEVRWMTQGKWLELAQSSYPLVRHILETEFARKLG